MTEIFLRIVCSGNMDDFYEEFLLNLQFALGTNGRVYEALDDRGRDASVLVLIKDIIIALGSAGAFSTVYQVVSMYLTRSKDRELTLERKDIKITIKGHRLPEERELAQLLLDESVITDKPKRTKPKRGRMS